MKGFVSWRTFSFSLIFLLEKSDKNKKEPIKFIKTSCHKSTCSNNGKLKKHPDKIISIKKTKQHLTDCELQAFIGHKSMNHFAMLSPLLTGSKHEYTLVEGQKQNSVQTDSKLINSSIFSIHWSCQGSTARKVNCGCVYSAYILKPVLSGRNL